MKSRGLRVGIILMVLSGVVIAVCLLLPKLTNNHVSSEESMMVLIPAAGLFVMASALTLIAALRALKSAPVSLPDQSA